MSSLNHQRPRRALVASSVADEADTLSALLSLWNCDVRVARDWPAAVETAARFSPDLALIHLDLPGVGHDPRALPGLRGATLVGVAGRAGRRRPGAAPAGFDHRVALPVDPEALRQLVDAPAPCGRV